MNYAKFKIGQETIVSRLVWDVFAKYEAPEYPEEGVNEFRAYIAPDNLRNMVGHDGLQIYCCYDHDVLVGVLALKDKTHISLLFVHEDYHRMGIAKSLLSMAMDDIKTAETISKITVHSSPYARTVYERLGFTATDDIQQQNGIIFIPMVKTL